MKLLIVFTVRNTVGHSHPYHSTLGEEVLEIAQMSVCPRDFVGLGLGLLVIPISIAGPISEA